MNATAAGVPPDVDEFVHADVARATATTIDAPLVAVADAVWRDGAVDTTCSTRPDGYGQPDEPPDATRRHDRCHVGHVTPATAERAPGDAPSSLPPRQEQR